jgi:hypothetical protein
LRRALGDLFLGPYAALTGTPQLARSVFSQTAALTR